MSESVQHDEQCSSLHAEGLREGHRLRVFENWVLREVCGSKR